MFGRVLSEQQVQRPHLSVTMWNGRGTNSMCAAYTVWNWMFDELSRLIEPFEQARQSLEEQWSGTSAIRMTEAAVKFRDWLDTLIRQILATREQIQCLADAFSCAVR